MWELCLLINSYIKVLGQKFIFFVYNTLSCISY